MHITDTIADMLTRIRNANSAKHDTALLTTLMGLIAAVILQRITPRSQR